MLVILNSLHANGDRSQVIQDKHAVHSNKSLHTWLRCRENGTTLSQVCAPPSRGMWKGVSLSEEAKARPGREGGKGEAEAVES